MSDFPFNVKLQLSQWMTKSVHGQESIGFDIGGPVTIVKALEDKIAKNENIGDYVVGRVVEKTMFSPHILIEGDKLPEELCTTETLATLKFGTVYNIYISFQTEDEATMFQLSNASSVSIDFR